MVPDCAGSLVLSARLLGFVRLVGIVWQYNRDCRVDASPMSEACSDSAQVEMEADNDVLLKKVNMAFFAGVGAAVLAPGALIAGLVR